MNITTLFLAAADKVPSKKAIIEPSRSITYGQLATELKETAAYFQEAGIKKGDRVLVFVPMSIDLYRTVLALFYIGATAVFLDQWASLQRLKVACQLADCQGFIGSTKSRILGLFLKDIRRIPIKLQLNKRLKKSIKMMAVEPDHSALITFTTGSTGIPKAADRSHALLNHQFEALIKEIKPYPEEIDMPVLPIVLFLNLGLGSTSVIADYNARQAESLKPAKILRQIEAHKVNRITASPYFVKSLAKHLLAEKIELSFLQKVVTGGAPVFPLEAAIYLKAFKAASIQIVYGSTEAEPISSIEAKALLNDHRDLHDGLAVGSIYPDLKLQIIPIKEWDKNSFSKVEFQKLDLEEGEIGEIVVSGQHVLGRYFRNDEAFIANKFVVEDEIWHRTGDSGILKNGQLFLTGRCKELIKVSGTYQSGFIIENSLQEIEGISGGTLIELQGKSVLVIESEQSPASLKAKLSDFEFDQIEVRKKIPRDPRHHSKIDYQALKKALNKKP